MAEESTDNLHAASGVTTAPVGDRTKNDDFGTIELAI